MVSDNFSCNEEINEFEVIMGLLQIEILSSNEIGNGYTVVKIGGKDYLKIVNFDLDSDSDQLIQLVKQDGYFDQTALNSLPLEPEHIQGILHSLLEQGIIWVDFKTTPTRYYILAAFQGFDI